MVRIYRTTRITRRDGSQRVYAIADRSGKVLVYTIGYPSLDLIEDAEYALSLYG